MAGSKNKKRWEKNASKTLRRGRVGVCEMEQGERWCFQPNPSCCKLELVKCSVALNYAAYTHTHARTPTFLKRCAGKECTYLQFVHVPCRPFLAYQLSTLLQLHPNATQSVCIQDARTVSSGNIIEKDNLTVCLVTHYCIDLLFMGELLIESVEVKLKCSAGGNEKPSTGTSNPH